MKTARAQYTDLLVHMAQEHAHPWTGGGASAYHTERGIRWQPGYEELLFLARGEHDRLHREEGHR